MHATLNPVLHTDGDSHLFISTASSFIYQSVLIQSTEDGIYNRYC